MHATPMSIQDPHDSLVSAKPSRHREKFLRLLKTNPVVTAAGSQFEQDEWNYEGDTRRRKSRGGTRIDFSLKPSPSYGHRETHWLPKGKCLPDYPELLSVVKHVFAAMRFYPRSIRGVAISVNTYITVWAGFRQLIRLMTSHGYYSFRELNEHTWAVIGGANAKMHVYRAIFYLNLYRDLLSEDIPCEIESLLHSFSARKSKSTQTLGIPDDKFKKILELCLTWISRSEYILQLHERSISIAESSDDGVYKLAHIFEELESPPDYSVTNSQQLTTAASMLQTACVVFLHAVSGMRLSEIAALAEDSLVSEQHSDVTYWLLKSTHAKFSEAFGGWDEVWLCGEKGAMAFKTLQRLSAHYRKHTQSKYVICPTRRLSQQTLENLASSAAFGHNFVRSLFNYQPVKPLCRMLAQAGILDETGKPLRIRTHQFRRTFARWVARYDLETGLLALQEHFKHASLFMTVYYAYIDRELLIWFEEERQSRGASNFERILTAEALGGIGGLAIKRELDQAIAKGALPKEFRGVTFRAEREKLIQTWMANGIYPRRCSGHYCVPRDPNFDCENQGGGFGCNVGNCGNAVYLPEHAPLLQLDIQEEIKLSQFLESCSFGKTPYADSLRGSIKAKSAHLASITPNHHAQNESATAKTA